jgi:glycosyltransferase involved in cell wall biosynthesis
MKIGIDARSIGAKICGVSRVAFCEIKALSEIDRENEYIVYTDTLDAIPGISGNFRIVRTHCNRMNPMHDFMFYRFLKKDQPDLLHVMHSWLPLIIPRGIKKVVTIYDIFTVTDPLFFIKRKPFHWIFREYFRLVTWMSVVRADVIITISNFCRNEIRHTFRAWKKRIEVVYLSPGIVPDEKSGPAKRLVDKDYLFYLGNFRSYKNVATLIRGYAIYAGRNSRGVDLVIAGNDEDTQVKALAQELGMEQRIHFFHRPDDGKIDSLYHNASAFVFPSKYEGFGIPPIEAMSYGVPVIISNADALVETSGNAALVFDRHSPYDLAKKIEMLLSDSRLRETLIRKGHKNTEQYKWRNSAEKLKCIYTSIINQSRGIL